MFSWRRMGPISHRPHSLLPFSSASPIGRWPKFVLLYDLDGDRSFVEKMADFPVVVTSEGVNFIAGEVSTQTSCNMMMNAFPNDIQTCQIKLAPLPIGIP